MTGPIGGPGRINRHPPRSIQVTIRCARCDARAADCAVLVAQDGEIQNDTTAGCLECGYLNTIPATDPDLEAAVADYIFHAKLEGGY